MNNDLISILQSEREGGRFMNNDLINREALKKAITQNRNIDRNAVCDVLDIIDNAPIVEPTFGMFREMLCAECGKRPQTSNNAELFKQTFGIYATEVWAMKEADFLKWLNAEVRGEE